MEKGGCGRPCYFGALDSDAGAVDQWTIRTVEASAELYEHARCRPCCIRAVEGQTMEGLITWCNNALGIVYLATAPGVPEPIEVPF